jgi:hypothetical protein
MQVERADQCREIPAEQAASAFIAAISRHRHFERQTDPPLV